MRALVVTSHGDLCNGLVHSLEMIAGKTDTVYTISLNEGIEAFSQSMENHISELLTTYNEILILCDMKGGTPYNEALKQQLTNPGNIKLVAGVNLPMLVEVSLNLQLLSLEDLVSLAIESGKISISN